MKTLWNRITLMRYATDRDDGRIPKVQAALYCAGAATACWIAWAGACMIVKG